jgi:trk system potassium uptake protein TrkH
MALAALLRPLGALWTALGIAAVLTAIAAMALGESDGVSIFVATGVIGVIPGVLVLTATRGIPINATPVEALGLALLAWLTGPIIAALPFYFSGQFDAVGAAFEAFSAVTTTGAILLPPEDLSRVLVFWRAELSWMGGYATLLLAAAVFAALDKDAPAIRRSALLTISPDNVFSHLQLAALRIGLIYAVLTGFLWLGFILTGQSLYVSTILAMSAISTGGYEPFSGGLSTWLDPTSITILALGCLAGALNISLFWDMLRDRRSLLEPDLVGIAVLTMGIFILYTIAAPGQLYSNTFDALFAVTTSGHSILGQGVPVVAAALFAALIGGAAASTAGGVKVSRILLLWRRMGAELALLADPSSVSRIRFRGRTAPDRALISIWAYVLAFAATLGLGGVALAFTGLTFEQAFAAVAAALSNAGPLYVQAGEGQAWSGLSRSGQGLVIPIMILGRLEVLAALAAVWAIFTRR